MQTITSRDNSIVRAYRELAREPDPNGARLLLDGAHLVRDAHAARLSFESVAIAASRLVVNTEEGELARALESQGVPVVHVTDAVFASMSPVRSPSGIAAVALRTPFDLSAVWNVPDGFTLVVVDVQDPGNLGAVCRVAEAGGVTGVVVTGVSAHPFAWKTLRGGMGSALRLPIVSTSETHKVFDCIRAVGAKTIASVPRGGRTPDEIDWTGHTALLLGGEGPGLSPAVTSQCDQLVTIPMAAAVESLNVAVAAGILIYAARRQRP